MKLFILLLLVVANFLAAPVFAQHTGGTDTRDSVEKKPPVISNPGPSVNKTKTGVHTHVIGSDLMLSQKEKMKMQVMKAYTCPDHPHLVTDKPGRCPECGSLLNRTSKEKMKMEIMGLYACTAHPHVSGKKDAECRECGSTLRLVKQKQVRKPKTETSCENRAKSGKCLSCATGTMRSSKEKMKMEVMKVCCCEL
jgi:hypothetical protein